jgi:sulfur carrier protein
MDITVNGKAMTVAEGTTGSELLLQVDINAATLVAEVNGEIMRRADFLERTIQPGDNLELVTLVGGG